MDMFRTLTVLFLCLVLPCVLAVPGYPGGRTCSRALDCRKGECCRDRKGNLLGATDEFGGPMLVDSSVRGRCSRRPSGPGQLCGCGCTKGPTCYRTVTGRCCPPRTCWTDKAVKSDKDKWAKCFSNPDCPLPS